MSSNKRYNQILFLMTLSVYMGLVLAGGASPALAQAAMAKGFELKTELEAKDDLDKKPNDEKSSQTSDSTYEASGIIPAGYDGKADIEKAVSKAASKYAKIYRLHFDLTGSGYEPENLPVIFSTGRLPGLSPYAEPIFENDQSVLTTNLPRAGLDKLLAVR